MPKNRRRANHTAKILSFPVMAQHHGASAPEISRAASAAIVSAVIPAALTRGHSKVRCHHSDGMRSRCAHFRAADTPAPISDAMASGEAQSPMIERNEIGESIESSLGQIVLICKPNVSHDCGRPRAQTVPMAQEPGESAFRAAFRARVKQAREARDLTQEEIAELLDISQGNYKQYETRSLLPHRLVPKFVGICGVDFDWLFTGRGRAPVTIPKRMPPPIDRRVRRRA